MRRTVVTVMATLVCVAALFNANAGPVGTATTAQTEFESPYHVLY